MNMLVTRPDEGNAKGYGHAYIPTFGHIASSFDAYRTVAVHSVENRPESWALTDTNAAAALGRIVDGPIRSHKDLLHAENGLRAILLNDFVEVVVPCVKAEQTDALVQYLRLDKLERNEAAFAAFQTAPCRDLLFAIEYVQVSQGVVTTSSNPSSHLVNQPLENLAQLYGQVADTASEAISALPLDLGITSYFSRQGFVAASGQETGGFIDELYRRIYRPWMDIAQNAPTLAIDVRLPPLLAIVLSRAANREQIPEVLSQLRKELAPVRSDLKRMNALLDSTMNQADLHAQVQKVNQSFDAIVPEALLTDAQRRSRRLISIFNFARPLRNLYSIAIDPFTVDREKFLTFFKDTQRAVASSSRIVSRSVSASAMADLLRLDSTRESVMTHFSASEVRLLADPK